MDSVPVCRYSTTPTMSSPEATLGKVTSSASKVTSPEATDRTLAVRATAAPARAPPPTSSRALWVVKFGVYAAVTGIARMSPV